MSEERLSEERLGAKALEKRGERMLDIANSHRLGNATVGVTMALYRLNATICFASASIVKVLERAVGWTAGE